MTTTTRQPIPRLNLVRATPIRLRESSEALTFLRSIEHLVVDNTMVIGGELYFIVEVYLSSSHIPTVLMQDKQAMQCAARKRARHQVPRDPDFCVLRRYSDFEELRGAIWRNVDQELQRKCSHCNTWMAYFSAGKNQPKLFTKLLHSTESHIRMLGTFMNTVVDLAIRTGTSPPNPTVTRQNCTIRSQIAPLVQKFLRPTENARHDGVLAESALTMRLRAL